MSTRTATTHYVQLVHAGRQFAPDDWTPWLNCTGTLEDTATLAAHKWIREAGYAGPSVSQVEFAPFTLDVFVTEEKSPRHANGRFATCHGFKMVVSKEGK
jgi:hypothetical protein